ncbi:hypothetical protein ACFVMC_29200 [Nocardia sp. NPDC127579]|uniref:hypothetical protein n=1 Tax=Nocardia sp. NPDC127579 TaxID=3345402 RepID=UPI00363E7915
MQNNYGMWDDISDRERAANASDQDEAANFNALVKTMEQIFQGDAGSANYEYQLKFQNAWDEVIRTKAAANSAMQTSFASGGSWQGNDAAMGALFRAI